MLVLLGREMVYAPVVEGNTEATGVNLPNGEALVRLARHWKVSADYLLGLVDTPSGLSPDQFLVDLDVYDARDPGADWSIKIPRRCVIVDFDTWRDEEAREDRERSRARRRRHEKANTSGSRLAIVGVLLMLVGFVCWAFPTQVLRGFVQIGLIDPDKESGFSALSLYLRVVDAGPWLCTIGAIMLVGGKLVGRRSG